MRLVAVLIVGCAIAGCGEEAAPREPAAPAQTPTPTPDRSAGLDPGKTELRRAADAYYAAYARKRYEAVCETLAPSERRHFHRIAGSCPKAFSSPRLPARRRRVMRDFRAGAVRIRGDRATISITTTTSNDEIGRLYGLREDGRWWISRRRPD